MAHEKAFTSRLRGLHSRATGILLRREALLELLEEAETDFDRVFTRQRLAQVSADYTEVMKNILLATEVHKMVGDDV